MRNTFSNFANAPKIYVSRIPLVVVALIATTVIVNAQSVPLPDGPRLKTLAAKHHLLIGRASLH